MRSVARALGGLCLLLATVVAAIGVYVFVEGVQSSTPYADVNTLSKDAATVYLLVSLCSALVLATIGATAIVAANASTQAVLAARAADRLARDQRQHAPVPPVYGPQAHDAAVASTVPPSAPGPGTMPPSEGQRWGPPTGPPVG